MFRTMINSALIAITYSALLVHSAPAVTTSGTSFGGAGTQVHNGDNVNDSFNDVDHIRAGYAIGSGNFTLDNNGPNVATNTTKRDTNYGGQDGSFNGAFDDVHVGDDIANTFDDVGTINSGFAQGSGIYNIGNNGAYSGNDLSDGSNMTKRDTTYGGSGGSFNGAGDEVQLGDNISNGFNDVGTINSGFAQGSGTFNIGNNGAYGGNTLGDSENNMTRRDTNYGGTNGTFNGAGDEVHVGENISNSFDDVDEVNSGFAQGSGTYNIINNGAFGGNTFTADGNMTKRDTTYGGTNGTFNGAGDEVHIGDNIAGTFDDIDTVNAGFAQGSGNFTIENNGALGGNDENDA